MWPPLLTLTTLSAARAATPGFEELVRLARVSSPTAQMGEADLAVAHHRLGQATARLMPQISASDRHTYRYNSPEKYTFSLDSDVDCDEEQSIFCLPFAITDGQITLPDNRLSNIFSLSGALPISSTFITNVAQQSLSVELTRIHVDGQDERLVLDLVREYAELQYTVGALTLYEESLALAEETLRAVRGRHAVGEATLLDLDQALLDVERAALSVTQLERTLPTDMARLALLSGSALAEGLQVCPFSEGLDTGASMSLESATRLESAELELRLDRLDRTSARLAVLPTLTVVSGLSYSGNGIDMAELSESFLFDSWYVGGNLSVTLFDGFGSYHARRSAAASLQKTEIDVENTRRSLLLDDQELALRLTELAEDLALSERRVALQEREVQSSRSRFFDSGDISFERYAQARAALEQLQTQHLSLLRQQLQLTAQRWVAAGQGDALLEQLYARERGHASAAACRAVAPT